MNNNIKKPVYILSALPSEDAKINNFFSSDEESVKHLLENPGGLRGMGWDLQTLSQAKLIKGDYFEILNGERKKIHLYENGVLILMADANQDFLGWGRDPEKFKESPRLNPVAIIEVTYNFINFYKKLFSYFKNTPTKIKLVARIKNTKLDNNNKLYLNPYSIGTYAWMFDDERCFAPDEEMQKEIECDASDLLKNPEKYTYLLIEKLYTWFGMTIDKIPLVTSDDEQNKIIDVEKIKKL